MHSNHSIRLAIVKHFVIAEWTGSLSVSLPIGTKHPAFNATVSRPLIGEHVNSTASTRDKLCETVDLVLRVELAEE